MRCAIDSVSPVNSVGAVGTIRPILLCLTALFDRRNRLGRNSQGCCVILTNTRMLLVRSLESLADSEHTVNDDGIDAFVSLQLFPVSHVRNIE